MVSFPIEEIIQVQVIIFKRILKLERDIIVITDKKYWKEMYGDINKTVDNSEGEALQREAYIYIKPTHHNFKALTDTIIHELLHIKYPKYKESQILKKTKEYIN